MISLVVVQFVPDDVFRPEYAHNYVGSEFALPYKTWHMKQICDRYCFAYDPGNSLPSTLEHSWIYFL